MTPAPGQASRPDRRPFRTCAWQNTKSSRVLDRVVPSSLTCTRFGARKPCDHAPRNVTPGMVVHDAATRGTTAVAPISSNRSTRPAICTLNSSTSGIFMSALTTGTNNSAKPEYTVRDPSVSGDGLVPATSLPLNTPVTLSVNVIVPSRRGSRSSKKVSRRHSTPVATPTLPPGRTNRSSRLTLKSASARLVPPLRDTLIRKVSNTAVGFGVQSPWPGSLRHPPLNGL